MRSIVKAGLVLLCAASLQAQSKWLTNPIEARNQARKENKVILLDFTGSDWCPPCKRLKAEVFDTPQFDEFARKKLVLLEVDFPRDKSKLNAATQAENAKLKQRFGVNSYPTVILLDQNSQELGRMKGYGGGSPEAYIQRIEAHLAKAKSAPATVPPSASGAASPAAPAPKR
jgi:thioredoxin-related protein